MLFSSIEFLFVFLPLVVAGAVVLHRAFGTKGALIGLVGASLFFYTWWNPPFLALLLASILGNYVIGERLRRAPSSGLLIAGVTLNLGLIAVFKYADFFLGTLVPLTGEQVAPTGIILPLAISFFTFQQIAYLVDSKEGRTEAGGFLNYVLFVSFFPQLIAGPIVHHRDVVPQFQKDRAFRVTRNSFAVGMMIFTIGLYKKVVFADGMALHADLVFDNVDGQLSLIDAWTGTLAYTFQIYFDFSGYSDMAIGLAYIFGIRLPQNFNSPYKATSIIDFWRRWHMTLSMFLRDYLYIRLGGSQSGKPRQMVNVMITMLLGGLWHGAAWTFVAWGAFHGFLIVLNHLWRRVVPAPESGPSAQAVWTGRLLTFFAVMMGWVLFRAESFSDALMVYQALFGLSDGPSDTSFGTEVYVWIAGLLLLVFLAPNTNDTFFAAGDDKPAAPVKAAVVPRFAAPLYASAAGMLALVAMLVLYRGADAPDFVYMVF